MGTTGQFIGGQIECIQQDLIPDGQLAPVLVEVLIPPPLQFLRQVLTLLG